MDGISGMSGDSSYSSLSEIIWCIMSPPIHFLLPYTKPVYHNPVSYVGARDDQQTTEFTFLVVVTFKV